MADKRADHHRDSSRQQSEQDKSHPFINEKIVRPPMTKRQEARRVLLTVFCAVLFGVLSAVCFVLTRPVAQRLMGQEIGSEGSQITIPKDEPETVPSTGEASVSESVLETEPVDEMIRSELEKYQYSMDDFNKLYGNLRSVAADADNGLVVVHSIQHEMDWFDNPIETSGQFSGVVIARAPTEILILTPEKAVEAADTIEVAFSDGTVLPGTVKQSDSIMELAVVGVDGSQMNKEQFDKVKVIALGNSYGVKQGDVVVAVGAPAGIVRSSAYGSISCVLRNVQAVDGATRIFYADVAGDSSAGTFVLNTEGELIGWTTDKYDESSASTMTKVAAVSDYKGVLEKMSNGSEVPYFGIQGQEVSQAMEDSGMPEGIYVITSVNDSPAYNAGIQPGDVITWVNGAKIGDMKDFQNQIEALSLGDKIKVAVLRSGKNGYTEIEFQVTIGAR